MALRRARRIPANLSRVGRAPAPRGFGIHRLLQQLLSILSGRRIVLYVAPVPELERVLSWAVHPGHCKLVQAAGGANDSIRILPLVRTEPVRISLGRISCVLR